MTWPHNLWFSTRFLKLQTPGLVPLNPWDRKVTANQFNVLNDHPYAKMKLFYPDGNSLFQDDSAPPSTGYECLLNGWWGGFLMSISHQLNTYRRCLTDALDSTLHHNHGIHFREYFLVACCDLTKHVTLFSIHSSPVSMEHENKDMLFTVL